MGAVVPPIYQTSLFTHEDCAAFEEHMTDQDPHRTSYTYSRIGNPNLTIVQDKLAKLEHTGSARIFSSGMAAISAAIMSATRAGSHVVCVDTCYGPTKQFLQDYLPKFGVATTFVEGLEPGQVLDAIRPETSLVYLESPSSIIFRLQDIEAIASFCTERGIATAIDNSYSSPILQTPADFGVDMVIHSATKYLCGHSDVVAGALCLSDERAAELDKAEFPLLGAALPPFPAWLMLRGMRTLGMRVRHSAATANRLAEFLVDHPKVEQIFHPGHTTFPQNALFKKQMRGSGGLISFQPVFQTKDQAIKFADSLRVFQLGVSWGGFESLCVPLQYSTLSWQEPRWIIRLYCGFEAVEDLLEDLEQAFNSLAC